MGQRLGDILKALGLVDDEGLEAALRRKAKLGGRIGEHLVAVGAVSEADLLRGLARQRHVPYADETLFAKLDKRLRRLVPRSKAFHYRIVPVRYIDGQLILATCESGNLERVRELVDALGHRVRLVLARRKHIEEAIARLYAMDSGSFTEQSDPPAPARHRARRNKPKIQGRLGRRGRKPNEEVTERELQPHRKTTAQDGEPMSDEERIARELESELQPNSGVFKLARDTIQRLQRAREMAAQGDVDFDTVVGDSDVFEVAPEVEKTVLDSEMAARMRKRLGGHHESGAFAVFADIEEGPLGEDADPTQKRPPPERRRSGSEGSEDDGFDEETVEASRTMVEDPREPPGEPTREPTDLDPIEGEGANADDQGATDEHVPLPDDRDGGTVAEARSSLHSTDEHLSIVGEPPPPEPGDTGFGVAPTDEEPALKHGGGALSELEARPTIEMPPDQAKARLSERVTAPPVAGFGKISLSPSADEKIAPADATMASRRGGKGMPRPGEVASADSPIHDMRTHPPEVPSPEPAPTPPVPEVQGEPFGNYTLLRKVKTGGMAEVFEAQTRGLEGVQRHVAIKRILPNLTDSEEFVAMFIDEAKIMVQLSHASIGQVYELGKVDRNYFIAMEYIHGRDLNAIFVDSYTRGEKVPIPIATYVIQRVLEGLDYAHRKCDLNGNSLGIVHRDVSPANILCSFEGTVKIIDFGIAKAVSKVSLTRPGLIKGKISYMSPEQMRGRSIDRRSDIFAATIVFYEMLAGKRLFSGNSDVETIRNVLRGDVPPLLSARAEVPEDIAAAVHRALERDPAKRFQWASDMSQELQRAMVRNNYNNPRSALVQYMADNFGGIPASEEGDA